MQWDEPITFYTSVSSPLLLFSRWGSLSDELAQWGFQLAPLSHSKEIGSHLPTNTKYRSLRNYLILKFALGWTVG